MPVSGLPLNRSSSKAIAHSYHPSLFQEHRRYGPGSRPRHKSAFRTYRRGTTIQMMIAAITTAMTTAMSA
jgi:hypothetical protein